MNAKNIQFIISLIETEYEEQKHPTFAYTVYTIQNQVDRKPSRIMNYLKNKHGPPTGSISRVVSKRVYEHLTQHNETVFDVINNAAEFYETQPHKLSDDQLVRYIRSQY